MKHMVSVVCFFAFSILEGSDWLPKMDLEERLLEKITDEWYEQWIQSFNRLVAHPLFAKEKEFILSYRKPLATETAASTLYPVTLESDGTRSVEVKGNIGSKQKSKTS